MPDLSIDKFIFYLYFILPGFISLKVYDLIFASERRDFSKSFFDLISYSAINYAIFFWLIGIISTENYFITNKICYYSLSSIILFLGPLFWPFLIKLLTNAKWFTRFFTHPIKKPWDFVFSKRESYWIIVHLKDGRKIGGKFDVNSFASSNPAEEQIYIEEVWKLTRSGIFKEKVERSKGIIILNKEIMSIEFFEG